MTEDLRIPGIRSVRLFQTRGVYGGFRYSVSYSTNSVHEALKLRRERGFEIIHGHSGKLEVAAVTQAISALGRFPAVHTVYSPARRKHCQEGLAAFLCKRIDRFIAISNNVKRSLLPMGISEEKISVIPPIMDYSQFRPGCGGNEVRSQFGIEDNPIILYLGNLSETKGVMNVIDMLRLVVDKVPDIRLMLGLEYTTYSGPPMLRDSFWHNIHSQGLSDNIIEIGLSTQIWKHIDAADVIVAPFVDTYGIADYPLVVQESMATGKPVITTNVGGLHEIIDDGRDGLFTDQESANDLAMKVLELISDPGLRNRIGRNARESIMKKLPLQESLSRIRDVYEEVL